MSRIVNITDSVEAIPSGYSSTNSSYSSISSSYPITNAYTDTSSTSYAYISCNTGSRASTYVSFTFDFSSIPSGATITSVSASAKGRISSTNYISTAVFQLYTNTTAKGSSTDFRTTTATTYTLSSTGSWTRSEINNLQLRATATRGTSNTSRAAYIYFYGAEVTINYSYQQTFYEITASTNNQNITIVPISDEVKSGDNTFIRISGNTDNLKVLDNNVDVTSFLVEKQYTNPSYTVNTAPNANYGFALTNEWYTSKNKAVNSSAAVARVTFDLPVLCNITFTYINYAEATYDFGIFSKLDTALTTSGFVAESNSGDTTTDAGLEERRLNTSAYNTSSQQTLTYSNVTAGEHFIDVKFGKDQGTNSNNDTLQFKVQITALETIPTGTYYSYDLTNVLSDHTIVISAGSKIYIKVSGVWEEASELFIKSNGSWVTISDAYKKINGSWVKQADRSALFDENVKFVYFDPTNGHDYVDLGLPSGTLWATMNVGANSSVEYGNYYAWGEIETKNKYTWNTYKFGANSSNPTKYNDSDGLTELELEDDAARVNWGGNWRTPTSTQLQELINNCTWTLGTVSGITGYTVSNNGNSIFLPASGYFYDTSAQGIGTNGYYLSSTRLSSSQSRPLVFNQSNKNINTVYRYIGCTVRPVIIL